ncbi:MAG: glycoside hydrolase family 3 N-terminal domain-containing protein, partial [bacterium]
MKDLEKIVSRLILIDFQDPEFAAKYPFAGYILFHKDIDQSENGWKNLKEFNSYYIKLFRDKHNVNIFSAVDQEGGVVFRFDYPDFPAVFSQYFVKNQETAYKISKLNGLILKYLGFNLNFSPVMDVNTNQNNPIIGIRSFGKDHHLVAKLSFQYIKGYKDAGVLCTGKHFPGHGDTNVDSHLALPYSRVSFEHLYPFLYNKLFLPSIMTAHVVYRNVDYLPSTLSKKTLRLMDFNGLVFSDALNMKALNNYKWEDILINSILAGVDVLLILGDDKIKEESIKFLSKIAEKNDNFKQIVISKYLKINEFLQKYNIF